MAYPDGCGGRIRCGSEGYSALNIMPNLTAGPETALHAGLSGPENDALEKAVATAAHHLLERQRPDGHWVFELEADALGAEIALRAGFDPVRGAAFFNRLPDPGDQFLGTHPPTANRLAVVAKTVARLRKRGL